MIFIHGNTIYISATVKAALTINECGQYPDVRLRIPTVPTALLTKVPGLGVKRDAFFLLLILVATKPGRRDWSSKWQRDAFHNPSR